ncbi:ATP-binding protein [Streptomyces sp. NPDC056390]|uniref:sensor histidine kinase n=1 Tax=Streptomyces sp. NPDC056390 TaxID=3345806 RepID=UPI0035D886B1
MMNSLDPTDFGRLFQALKFCVLLHDAATKDILWANQAACDVLGFTVDELRPLKAPDMSSNARQYARDIGVRWLQRAVDDGASTTEWCYRSKAGEDIITEATATLVDLAPRPVVMVQFRDIAQEKATRRDLFRTEGRLHTFLGSLDEGIVVLDDDATVTFASQSAAGLLALEVESLEGARFSRFCADGGAAVLADVLAATPRGSAPCSARLRLRPVGGAPRWFIGRCQYIDVADDLSGRLLLFHDITDQVTAEEEHDRDLQHLNHLARYNAMGDMAMAIAHEVSQPIAAARNFVAGVRGRLTGVHDGDDTLVWGLDSANVQIERASRILTSLRQYVGRLEQSAQLVDLNEVVAECRNFVDVRAAQSDVHVRWDLDVEGLPVRAERVLIGQVVMNLAFNAVEEMARWPRAHRIVEVSTRRSGDHGEVLVRDRGQGLSAFPEGRVFDGVFTSKENGSGIGLALSHRIVSRHDGTLSAAENAPHGSVFTARLPLSTDVSKRPERSERPGRPGGSRG